MSTESSADNADSNDASEGGKFTFQDMRLRVGDRVQLHLPASLGEERVFCKLIGYLENVSLLVAAPPAVGHRSSLREEDKVVVRVFSNQKAFAFDAYVNKVNSKPFAYLHLSFPEKIQGSVIRKEPRVKVRIIASAKRSTANDDGEFLRTNDDDKYSVIISNLSASGCMVTSTKSLFEKGDKLQLSFQIKLHLIDSLMTISTQVRSVSEDLRTDTNEGISSVFSYGLQFLEVEPNNTILLRSMIYQQMIEQPQTVV
jgi:c-di-GMP-binding flagellar brake protein YcgR